MPHAAPDKSVPVFRNLREFIAWAIHEDHQDPPYPQVEHPWMTLYWKE